MAASSCAFNSATALRRVFIPSNLGTSSCLHVTRIFVPALLPPAQQQQTRTYTQWWDQRSQAGKWASDPLEGLYQNTLPPAQATSALQPHPSRRPIKIAPRVKTKLARLPRDDEIREKYVYFRELQPDGTETLSKPQLVKEVLAGLDRKTESLEVQSIPSKDDLTSPNWPIAKIVNKKEELARKKKEKDQQKKQAAANKEKELEFNWALAPNDIEHKLRTLKKFLAKGYKVQLLLLKKSGKGAKATKEEAEALLGKIVEATTEVPGSMEWKRRDGKLLGSMKLFLQGKSQE